MWTFNFAFAATLLVAFSRCTEGVGAGGEVLREWFGAVSDFSRDCEGGSVAKNGEDTINSPIIREVGCDEEGADFNYKIKMNDKKGKHVKPKKGGVNLDGLHATVTFPVHHGEGYNDGLKLKKCFKLDGKTAQSKVRTIAGSFSSGGGGKGAVMTGRIVVTFRDDSALVLWASKDGTAAGVRRHFDRPAGKVANVTAQRSHKLVAYKDKYDFYHLAASVDHHSDESNNYFVTKDFKDFMNCRRTDSRHLSHCRYVKDLQAEAKSCSLKVKSITVDETQEAFCLDQKTQERYYSEDINKLACPTKGEGFNKVDVQGSLRDWLRRMNDDENDPFWMHPASEHPLDKDNPEIDILLPHYQGRKDSKNLLVRLESSDRVLLKTKMADGRIRAKVDPSDAALMDWGAPIRFLTYNNPLTDSTRGINFGDREATLFIEGRLHRGKLNGPVRIFRKVSNDKKGICSGKHFETGLSFVGHFKDGKPVGRVWRGLVGGSYITGVVDGKGELTGGDIAYIYQDLTTAFVGRFEDGIMKKGRESELVGEKCELGLKVPLFSDPVGPEFHYEPMTFDSIGGQPTIPDPLDSRYIYLGKSPTYPEAGEGSFAKRDIPSGTTYVTYGGNLWNPQEAEEKLKEESKLPPEEKELRHMYRYYDRNCEINVDLPPPYGDTALFRSALGHKTNHKFVDTNVRFSHTDSPRFGMIASMTTTREVKKGEEFFLHYGYRLGPGAPDWYKRQYEELLKERPELEEVLGRPPPNMWAKGGEEGAGGGASMGMPEKEKEGSDDGKERSE